MESLSRKKKRKVIEKMTGLNNEKPGPAWRMRLESLKNNKRYFLKFYNQERKEVTKEEYMNAEARAGFVPKFEGEPATSSFGCFREDLVVEGWTIAP